MLFCLFNVKTKLAPFFTKFKVWLRNANNLHLFILCLSVWFRIFNIHHSGLKFQDAPSALCQNSDHFLRQSELKILRLVYIQLTITHSTYSLDLILLRQLLCTSYLKLLLGRHPVLPNTKRQFLTLWIILTSFGNFSPLHLIGWGKSKFSYLFIIYCLCTGMNVDTKLFNMGTMNCPDCPICYKHLLEISTRPPLLRPHHVHVTTLGQSEDCVGPGWPMSAPCPCAGPPGVQPTMRMFINV